MQDIIFLQTDVNTITVGTGKLLRTDKPDPQKVSFYVNDYFQTLKDCWIIPEYSETMDLSEFEKTFLGKSNLKSVELKWHSFDETKFRKFFNKLRSAFHGGIIEKIVPVVFEHTTLPEEWVNNTLIEIAKRVIRFSKAELFLHGYSVNGIGRCGLTPEVIGYSIENLLTAPALAGTKLSSQGENSLKNPKDLREHQLVIDDIKTVLNQFGKCSVKATIPIRIGSLVHLKTELCVSTTAPINLVSYVKKLHPSAALGVFPRTENAKLILKSSDLKMTRDQFGAPFGVQFPNGNSFCVASIRSFFWKERSLNIVAGCGIIEESELEQEIEELKIKLNSIKIKLN